MNRCRNHIVFAAVVSALIAGPTPALAQTTTFQNYHCADGAEFIVAFYPYDTRAHMQIDGGAITLRRRLAFSGQRYQGNGVTLRIAGDGAVTVKRRGRRETACRLL